MNAVTYSNPDVVAFLNDEVIPIQVLFNTEPLATRYNLQWTPTVIVLDSDGKDYSRTVGYLSPEEFIPSVLIGIGKALFELNRFAEAIKVFDRIINSYKKSKATPEAIYFKGVALYKHTHEPKHLKEAYEELKKGYPESDWTLRAEPYSLL